MANEKENFLSFEEVRESGETNMYAINTVCALSGLVPNEVKYIMENYDVLSKKYLMK